MWHIRSGQPASESKRFMLIKHDLPNDGPTSATLAHHWVNHYPHDWMQIIARSTRSTLSNAPLQSSSGADQDADIQSIKMIALLAGLFTGPTSVITGSGWAWMESVIRRRSLLLTLHWLKSQRQRMRSPQNMELLILINHFNPEISVYKSWRRKAIFNLKSS